MHSTPSRLTGFGAAILLAIGSGGMVKAQQSRLFYVDGIWTYASTAGYADGEIDWYESNDPNISEAILGVFGNLGSSIELFSAGVTNAIANESLYAPFGSTTAEIINAETVAEDGVAALFDYGFVPGLEADAQASLTAGGDNTAPVYCNLVVSAEVGVAQASPPASSVSALAYSTTYVTGFGQVTVRVEVTNGDIDYWTYGAYNTLDGPVSVDNSSAGGEFLASKLVSPNEQISGGSRSWYDPTSARTYEGTALAKLQMLVYSSWTLFSNED
jgi:hypothetical protein